MYIRYLLWSSCFSSKHILKTCIKLWICRILRTCVILRIRNMLRTRVILWIPRHYLRANLWLYFGWRHSWIIEFSIAENWLYYLYHAVWQRTRELVLLLVFILGVNYLCYFGIKLTRTLFILYAQFCLGIIFILNVSKCLRFYSISDYIYRYFLWCSSL